MHFTPSAKQYLARLKGEYKDFIIYISGGCCEGSAVLVYDKNDFALSQNDIQIGEWEGIGVFIHHTHFGYVKDALDSGLLSLNAIKGNGSEFSLDFGLGEHFVLESGACEIGGI